MMALLRPFLYSTNRKFATRMVHTVLRGVTKDRLDLLGDAALPDIAKLSNLRALELSETEVTGPGLKALNRLPGLQTLSVSWQRLNKEQAKGLASLPTLMFDWLPL